MRPLLIPGRKLLGTFEDPSRDPHSEPEHREFGSSLELDKIPRFWVVTGWPEGDVVLRLKIRHNCNDEPTHIFCEIRIGRGTGFTPICDFESCVYDLAHPDESEPYLYEELPAIWHRDFAEMARRWAGFRARSS